MHPHKKKKAEPVEIYQLFLDLSENGGQKANGFSQTKETDEYRESQLLEGKVKE